jgi:hypothetical protein
LLVLIDESGCSGFKLNKGSSPYFTLGMTIFSDLSVAEKISNKISELRNVLCIGDEFKFSKSHPKIRDVFFSAVRDYDFTVRALVVDKRNITSNHLKHSHDNFYNYFLKMLLEYDAGVLHGATIKIDGRGDKIFRKTLNSYLRNQVGGHKIKKIKFADSKKDNLIQLADMVVGAIAKSNHKDIKGNKRWVKMLQSKGKIDNIWNFK